MVKSWELQNAPIAQWIERCPPEAEARVRVAVGVPNETHPELLTASVEQFIATLRFEGRSRLAELPGGIDGKVRDDFFKPS